MVKLFQLLPPLARLVEIAVVFQADSGERSPFRVVPRRAGPVHEHAKLPLALVQIDLVRPSMDLRCHGTVLTTVILEILRDRFARMARITLLLESLCFVVECL